MKNIKNIPKKIFAAIITLFLLCSPYITFYIVDSITTLQSAPFILQYLFGLLIIILTLCIGVILIFIGQALLKVYKEIYEFIS